MWYEMQNVEMKGEPMPGPTTWCDVVSKCRAQDEENVMCQAAAHSIRPRSDLYRSLLAWLKRHLSAERQTVKPGRQAKQGEMEWTGESMVL
jgi:hypothetical protein